jgi:CheY-like chemotaxis protein
MSNPLLTTAAPKSKATRGLTTASGKSLVLVVDDDGDTREMMRIMVGSLGCRVIEAGDGDEAVRLAEQMRPDLILMDTSLPHVDGLMATDRIRHIDALSKVKIIFLSGHAQPQARETALAVGGDAYFVKPVDFEELGQAIRNILAVPKPA